MAKAKSVADWFAMIEPEMAPIADALRDTIQSEGPGLSCKLAWGFPCWSGHKRLFSLAAHTAHCNLQLWYGAPLAQLYPDRIDGTGKALRHIKFKSVSEVDDDIREIIRAALALDQSAPKNIR